MAVNDCGQYSDSCTWSNLTGLSGVRDTKQAMIQFCEGVLGYTIAWGSGGVRKNEFSGYFSHMYVFSGPCGGEDSNNPANPDYAPRFADFIEEHQLGELTRSHVAINKYHSGRKCQVFAWTPDPAVLRQWYDNEKGLNTVKTELTAPTGAPLGKDAVK
jgi:hypothetical protein